MELKGKRIAFIGDSITYGYGPEHPENVYWRRIGALTGADVLGYGVGGTRIAQQKVAIPNEPWTEETFVMRARTMPDDLDAIVIFGGTNDFGTGDAPLGNMESRDPFTFYGACHDLLIYLLTRYPGKPIVIMTPTHRLSESDDTYNELGVRRFGKLQVYVDALREVAQYYGIPVVDLFRECPMQPKVESLRQMYMPDGLHPNDAGHELIARMLLNKLQTL